MALLTCFISGICGCLSVQNSWQARGGTLTVVVSSDKFNKEEKNKSCTIPDVDRMEIIKALKCVDRVLLETSWAQKRRDIIDNKIDIFVMGDDWRGKFDDLSDICKVVYLPRTPDISSTGIKSVLLRHSK